MVKKGKAAAKKEVPFGLDSIEKYNAEREEVSDDEDAFEAGSGDDEQVLGLGLSDDEYDFGEDDEEEGEDGEEGGYEFDEDEYDRREKLKAMNREDAGLIVRGKRDIDEEDEDEEDVENKPLGSRLKKTEIHKKGNENIIDELAEAKRLAKLRSVNLDAADFDMDISSVAANKKSKEQKMKEKFDAELDEIDLGKTEVVSITKKDDATTLEDKLERVKRESPEVLSLLQDFKEKLHELNNTIIPIIEKVKKGNVPTSEGISFLEAKHQLLLSYCTNISFYLMLKAQGQSVKDHPVVDQLARIRAILEKSKPIEKKLSYQIDKLVRSANLGALAGGDEDLTAKANPADLEVDSEDEEVQKLGLYKAPRVHEEAMETIDKKSADKRKKELQRRKESKMAQYLGDEFGDAPEESNPNLASGDYESTPQERELERLEELNMRRKEITRADKKKYQRRLEGINDVMAGLGDYNDLATYDDDDNNNGKEDAEYLARKRMRAHMSQIDNIKKAKREMTSGDNENVAPQKKSKTGQSLYGSGSLFADDEIDSDDEEQDNTRRPHFEDGAIPEAEAQKEEGDKRKATKRIEQNRGMVRIRNKDVKTPHLRYKRQFNRRVGRGGGAPKIRSQETSYSGEKRINKERTRSKAY